MALSHTIAPLGSGAPASAVLPVDVPMGVLVIFGVLAAACGALWLIQELTEEPSPSRDDDPATYREAA